VPYKTVGKEYIADRPEVEREIKLALRDALRKLRVYLSRKEILAKKKKRSNVYAKYLPVIARFAASLAGRSKPPSYSKLIPAEGEEILVERRTRN
jgi:DNA topoisomerase-6 subunit B